MVCLALELRRMPSVRRNFPLVLSKLLCFGFIAARLGRIDAVSKRAELLNCAGVGAPKPPAGSSRLTTIELCPGSKPPLLRRRCGALCTLGVLRFVGNCGGPPFSLPCLRGGPAQGST